VSKYLQIAKDLELPLSVVVQTFAILARRGAGKTYTASVLAEEMLEKQQQIIAIDPTGAWWGLKSHYPVVVFGGEHADIPLEESAGEVVARSIVENRYPAVIDLSLFRKGAMFRFMVTFAEALYRLNREPVHLFVDEADAVAPQARNYGGDENRLLGAMEDIVRRGRKRGIGCSLITQRPAVLNKNVLTQCECLVTLAIGHPKDIDAIKEWIGVHGDPEKGLKMISSLPVLKKGEAWFWAPGWDNLFQRVQVRPRRTFDSGATPVPGQKELAAPRLKEIDKIALGADIKATVERIKADDPKALRALIEQYKKQIQTFAPSGVTEVKTVEVPVIKEAHLERFESALALLMVEIQAITKDVSALRNNKVQELLKAPRPPQRSSSFDRVTRVKKEPDPSPSAPEWTISPSEQAVMDAAASFPNGATRQRIAVFSGRSIKSSSFTGAFPSLESKGCLHRIGDKYIMPITYTHLANPHSGTTLEDWLQKLTPSEAKVLRCLADAYPGRLTKTEVSERTGQSGLSSSFTGAFPALRDLELIEGRDDYRLNELLAKG
jgi:hypothetical protein